MTEPATSNRSRRRWLVAAVVGAVVVVLLVAGWFFAEGPRERLLSPPGSTVAEFSGEGARVTTTAEDGETTRTEAEEFEGVDVQMTESFTVRRGWQIHWETTGERFAMAIRGDQNFGTVVRREGPARGVTTPPAAGTFHIEVDAEGPWSIAVVQGD